MQRRSAQSQKIKKKMILLVDDDKCACSLYNPFFSWLELCHHHLSLLWGMARSNIYDALCTKWVQPFKSPSSLFLDAFVPSDFFHFPSNDTVCHFARSSTSKYCLNYRNLDFDQTYHSHHFIVTIALSENLRHIIR